jgi:hypothetical protein
MIALLLVGLIVLIVGKLRLTRSIGLTGKRARWYGLTLLLTAIPFTLLVGTAVAAITPESVLTHPLWSRIINYGLVIAYLVLLALPFRERQSVSNESHSSNDAS